MRKVEFCKEGQYGGVDKQRPAKFCVGIFHGFFSEGNSEEGLECYGLIEVPGGTVRMVQTHKMKFLDPPPETQDTIERNPAELALQEVFALYEKHYEECVDTHGALNDWAAKWKKLKATPNKEETKSSTSNSKSSIQLPNWEELSVNLVLKEDSKFNHGVCDGALQALEYIIRQQNP